MLQLVKERLNQDIDALSRKIYHLNTEIQELQHKLDNPERFPLVNELIGFIKTKFGDVGPFKAHEFKESGIHLSISINSFVI